MEMELDLVGDCKESKGHSIIVAKISVCSLSSQPVDHEENNKSAGTYSSLLINPLRARKNALAGESVEKDRKKRMRSQN